MTSLAQKRKEDPQVPKVLTMKDIIETPHITSPDLYHEYINYFVNEVAETQHLVVSYYGKNQKIHIDNLLPILKKEINSFITNQNRQPIEDSIYLKQDDVKLVYDKINFNSKKKPEDRYLNDLNEIGDRLSLLMASKEKVGLNLKWAYLWISNKTYYEDVERYLKSSKLEADLISNLYERGKSYELIGDFALSHKSFDDAIKMYYLARECIDNCIKDEKAKNYEQGLLCEKLAEAISSDGIKEGLFKASEYYLRAYDYFSKAGDNTKATLSYFSSISNNEFLWAEYLISDSYTGVIEQHESDLKNLKNWYYSFKSNKVSDAQISSLGLSNIALSLQGAGKYKEALIYYLKSLTYAINYHKENHVENILNSISYTYSLLKNEKLATGYADLSFYLVNNSNDQFSYYINYLLKANNFNFLKKYDSALNYINKIQYDTNLLNIFYPSYYEGLLANAFGMKNKIFNSINPKSDSAIIYGASFVAYQKQQLEYFQSLLQTESSAINSWLERSKNKIIENEKVLKLKALENELLAKKIANEISARNLLLTIATISVSAFFLISVFFFIKSKKTSKKLLFAKEQLLVSSTSDLRLRSGIKNHNLSNHYAKIQNLLERNQTDKAIEYCGANTDYFDLFYMSLLDDKTSISQEIAVLESFIQTEQIYSNKNIQFVYQTNNIDPEKTLFLSDVLVPLYENVLLNSVTQERNDYSYTIEIHQNDHNLHCLISDDGRGVKNIHNLIRKKSYLDMLKTRLINYYILKKSKEPAIELFNIESDIQLGTRIKFIIPYETI